MEHTPNKIEIRSIDTGLGVSTRPDETWLHFETSDGKKCSFCIEDKFPSICASTIKQWVFDKENNAVVYYRLNILR